MFFTIHALRAELGETYFEVTLGEEGGIVNNALIQGFLNIMSWNQLSSLSASEDESAVRT